MSTNQLLLLKQYNKQLQALNDVKSEEIKSLSKNLKNCQDELEKLRVLQKIKNKEKESPILRRQKIVQSCRSCGSKEEMLKNKDKQIKNLLQSVRLLEARQKDLTIKVQSLEQNKITPLMQCQTQLNHLNTNLRPQIPTLNHASTSKHSNKHSQQSLASQNKVLEEKVKYLQKRVFTLEDSNRILRQQILQYIHARKAETPLTSNQNLHHHHSCTVVTIRPDKYSLNNTSLQNEIDNSYIKHRLLREEWVNENSFNCENHCNYSFRHLLSPLKKENKPRKYANYDHKNLLQEHNETLQRKIQILKKQNQRLKQQISFTT